MYANIGVELCEDGCKDHYHNEEPHDAEENSWDESGIREAADDDGGEERSHSLKHNMSIEIKRHHYR